MLATIFVRRAMAARVGGGRGVDGTGGTGRLQVPTATVISLSRTSTECRSVGDVAAEQGSTESGLDLVGDETAQRTGPVDRVVALPDDEAPGPLGDLERDPAIGQAGADLVEHQLHDALDLGLGERFEHHDVVDPVEELGAEMGPQLVRHPVAGVRPDLAGRRHALERCSDPMFDVMITTVLRKFTVWPRYR